MSSRRAPARSRRVDDALSQLIDSLLPPLTLSVLGFNTNDNNNNGRYPANEEEAEEALAAAEEHRHRDRLDRAWRILDSITNNKNNDDDDAAAENINNASDLIKRKLLRDNASPDKAVRFSNLYSRLLTQPVLGQKWAILYLLYKLSPSGDDDGGAEEDAGGARSRSPLMNEGNLNSMLFRESSKDMRASAMRMAENGDDDDYDDGDDGPAIGSSVSQRGERLERRPSVKPAVQKQRIRAEDERHTPPTRHRTTSRARETVVQQPSASPQTVQPAQMKLTEPTLLRDLPYILQGLSSANVEFASTTTLKLPTNLSVPMISLLHTLAEPCLLYKGLSTFVDGSEGGLVSQALRAAIGNELRSYLSLVATLEGEIRRALTAAADETDSKGAVKGAVTLKRCVIWTREATMALRLMSSMVEQSKDKRGGQLITSVHGFSSSHGDPFVGKFAEKLLSHVTRPFYNMLRQWIYDGELSDPYMEFFVVEPELRPSTDPRRIASSVWEDKYKLDEEMIPSIMSGEFAKKVFLIGKSLNFIRYGCGDAAWVEAYSKEASKELRYGDTATLETSIDEAYKTTMARLIYLMDTKFKLFEHLKALKKYLLLGQGDFIALLMESLASNLDRPANSQYRHTLTAQLEHAIRSSNAQYDSPDVLRRLDARMLELSHGEIGWDCFTLEYKIDAPVDVVITPWGSTQYLKVFNFLWRVKRVEFALGSSWRRCMTGARGVLGSVEDKVGPDWKRARCVMAEMIHFICQLQYYILFEVIEASWDQLQAAISKPGCTLDDLIDAHTRYLNSITHKGLLGAASASRSSASGSKQPEESFLSQLHHILKIMLSYKDAVDGLYSFSVAEFTRRQERSAKIETRTAQGLWGITERDLPPPSHSLPAQSSLPGGGGSGDAGPGIDDHMLPSLRSRLSDLAVDFKARLNVLLGDLAYQPDVDMRFLGVVMNFNDVYEPVRRRRTATSAGASSKDRERMRRKAASGGDKGASANATATANARASAHNSKEAQDGPASAGS